MKVIFKKLTLAFISFSAMTLTLELGLRIYYAIKVGPSALTYGIIEPVNNHTVSDHGNNKGSYTTYFPNQKRVDYDSQTKETFNVTINNKGFRGSDFSNKKEPGVIRVVTLGASSTFGYGSRDHDTYPSILEDLLHSTDKPQRYEVINLGIPHTVIKQNYQLFLNEALPLNPDIVTFYEGANDTSGDILTENNIDVSKKSQVDKGRPPQATEPQRIIVGKSSLEALAGTIQIIKDIYDYLFFHTMMVKMIDHVRIQKRQDYYSYEGIDIEGSISMRADKFAGYLQKIKDSCSQNNIIFIVANQQVRTFIIKDNTKIKSISYKEELGIIMDKFQTTKTLPPTEWIMIVHNGIMKRIKSWAKESNTPFVDIIKAMDKNRNELSSWVHLTPAGNKIIAAELSKEISKQVREKNLTQLQ